MKKQGHGTTVAVIFVCGLFAAGCTTTTSTSGDKKEDLYAEWVWPPPPDEPKIRLIDVIRGRADVELDSRLDKVLFGSTPQEKYDWLKKPHAVEFDPQGRILVTDSVLSALFRFDLAERRVDVFGTKGVIHLVQPLGLDVSADGLVFVADVGIRQILCFDDGGKLVKAYDADGKLTNPSDVAVSPDAQRLYVTDSKNHRVMVIDRATGDVVDSFGGNGVGDGEFAFPTALSFDPDGNLLVVDQLNSRVQVFDPDGEYLDQFGGRGTDFGSFVRPKDVTVDSRGFIYVTDAAFNNLQLFDYDFTLLTFVGEGGREPGQFLVPSGVAVHGNTFAVVDQLGHRLRLFEFLPNAFGE
jgi:DNA-binding beta-propeller fold protein YncE